MPASPSAKLGIYVLALLGVTATLELACRHWQPLFRAASHRSLFKAALLERRLPQDIVFFGTSRTGEALRPGALLAELSERGAPPLSAYNVSTPYSSLDILQVVAQRFSTAPGMKVAVIEISDDQLHRNSLPWATEPLAADADIDARAAAWLQAHSALFAERKVFVLNSLGRLGVVALFGHTLDGTEEFGTDYVRAILGQSRRYEPSAFQAVDCRPRPDGPLLAAAGEDLAAERDIYAGIARAFAERGVEAAFYIPPVRDPGPEGEGRPAQRAFNAALQAATGRPVWDFSDCRLPPEYFRDATHLSHLGGSHFSRMVARQMAEDARFARGLGLHAVP
ncbi:MAG TPA: hypothetical protein VFA20_21260 [Myxococcaceae bacterium]|nr:hypothetical protein [Myxococcaceae bacterium]